MCRVYIIKYPCGHPVVAASECCAPDVHLKLCTQVQTMTMTCEQASAIGLRFPATCPASKFGRCCILVPVHPVAFATFCLNKGYGIDDVTALAPVWMYDMSGKKVACAFLTEVFTYDTQGNRISRPLTIEDYIVAFYMAKNPNSIRNRFGLSIEDIWAIPRMEAWQHEAIVDKMCGGKRMTKAEVMSRGVDDEGEDAMANDGAGIVHIKGEV